MYAELGWMKEEVVMAYFKLPSWNSPKMVNENLGKLEILFFLRFTHLRGHMVLDKYDCLCSCWYV
jgi:hypothetical protein